MSVNGLDKTTDPTTIVVTNIPAPDEEKGWIDKQMNQWMDEFVDGRWPGQIWIDKWIDG